MAEWQVLVDPIFAATFAGLGCALLTCLMRCERHDRRGKRPRIVALAYCAIGGAEAGVVGFFLALGGIEVFPERVRLVLTVTVLSALAFDYASDQWRKALRNALSEWFGAFIGGAVSRASAVAAAVLDALRAGKGKDK